MTSCFEIREEVNMDANGAGDFNLVVNLSQSKDQVKKYLQAEETNGQLKDKNVESIFKHVQVVMEGVKGLSDIRIDRDYEDYVFSVKAHFTNVNVLNDAIATVTEALDYLYVPKLGAKSFSGNESQFTRKFDYPIDPSEFNSLPGFIQYSLESAKVVSIYRFAKEIQGYSNKKAMVSPSKKAIKLESSIADIGKGIATMENRIDF